MTTTLDRTNFAPEGWHTVTPKIVVNGAREMVACLHDVFETTDEYLTDRPSAIKIGDSILMMGDTGERETTTAFLYVYFVDTNAV